MRSVEVTARTREEAIQKALQELGVERHEVHVEILEEGSKGFFGFGARDVKVRVTAENLPDEKPAAPEPVEETSKPSRRLPRQGGKSRRDRNRSHRRERRNRSPESVAAETVAADEEEKTEETNTHDDAAFSQEEDVSRPAEKIKDEQPSIEGDRARALLEEMIRLMGFEATVQAAVLESGDLLLTVESADSSLLIGRKGKTLEALQYLINRMVHAEESADSPDRILVDIAGYVDRRKAALEDMARRLARRAKETGKRIRVKPMSPQERRIIHVTLQNDPDVRTFSVGEAGSRCVIIAPKNERPPSRRNAPQRRRRGGGRRNIATRQRGAAQQETPPSDVAQPAEAVSFEDEPQET